MDTVFLRNSARLRVGSIFVLWFFAVLTALPLFSIMVEVAIDVFQWHRPPRIGIREVILLGVVSAPPALFGLAAEGLRRAEIWAAGLAMTVTLIAGAFFTISALLVAGNLSPYDDQRRKGIFAVLSFACFAVAMYRLAFDVGRCRGYLKVLRDRTVPAFEPVLDSRTPAADASRPTTEAESASGPANH